VNRIKGPPVRRKVKRIKHNKPVVSNTFSFKMSFNKGDIKLT
jgi:hypothetical protein